MYSSAALSANVWWSASSSRLSPTFAVHHSSASAVSEGRDLAIQFGLWMAVKLKVEKNIHVMCIYFQSAKRFAKSCLQRITSNADSDRRRGQDSVVGPRDRRRIRVWPPVSEGDRGLTPTLGSDPPPGLGAQPIPPSLRCWPGQTEFEIG